jgi:Zn-dependent M28 family amino/carboxypeptidase
LKTFIALLLCIVVSVGIATAYFINKSTDSPGETPKFDSNRALKDIEYQVSLGPRVPGSEGHTEVVKWIVGELENSGWEVEVQGLTWGGQPIQNITAKIGNGTPWVILGTHFDTRMVADRDPSPENRMLPVPGANDGASGVSVLLELARMAMGSQAFVQELEDYPDAVVIVDMIGDRDLNLCREGFSDQEILNSIWREAKKLGYGEYFHYSKECYIRDDHIAFLNAGIPAVNLIDIDYHYWHTVEDTIDKVSAESLQIIGETLLEWLFE